MANLWLMKVQARVKQAVKGVLFREGPQARRVRRGPSRGVVLIMDRRSDLQREFGLHESETHAVLRRLVRPGMTVYDIGAADGDTSLMFAQLVGDAGNVICFEPSAPQLERLRANLQLNVRLSERINVQELWLGRDNTVGPGGQPQHSVDALVGRGGLPAPEFVKIDVDGGELEVLHGMEEVMRSHHPCLLVETHGAEMERHCVEFLERLGYETTHIY